MRCIMLVIMAFLTMGCSQVKFELREGKCGAKKPYTKSCVILTSSDFWVDRADLVKIIESEGGDIEGCNATGVFWTVNGDIKKHIEEIRPKIQSWGNKNRI